jgi:hypothetical protein
MAKEKGRSSMGSSPVSGRLPMDYGRQDELRSVEASAPNKSNMTRARETSKEFSAGSPHPKAEQKEGPAGRQRFGSEELGVKETHFNEHRARASGMEGWDKGDCSRESD